MDAAALLREQFRSAHRLLEETVGDCSPQTLHASVAAKVGPVADIYAHVVYDEDVVVNRELRGQRTLFEAGGWAAKTGLDLPASSSQTAAWAAAVAALDLATFGAYAAAVYEATDGYLAGLDAVALAAAVEWDGGAQPLGSVLAAPVLLHMPVHQGEIAALKGVQELRAVPA